MKKFIDNVLEKARRILKKEGHSRKEVETPSVVPAAHPVPEKPFVTQARRRRELMLAKPSFLYIHDTANDVYHDRDCKFAQAIPDEVFSMLEGFPKEKQFCSSCYRKAMIRKGIASQTNRINSYVHAFNAFGAKNEDLYKLFITHKAQVVSISKGEQAVCLQVKDDRWRIQNQDGKLLLHHNNYRVRPGGERIFYDGFHRQKVEGSGTFTDIVRVMCYHEVLGARK